MWRAALVLVIVTPATAEEILTRIDVEHHDRSGTTAPLPPQIRTGIGVRTPHLRLYSDLIQAGQSTRLDFTTSPEIFTSVNTAFQHSLHDLSAGTLGETSIWFRDGVQTCGNGGICMVDSRIEVPYDGLAGTGYAVSWVDLALHDAWRTTSTHTSGQTGEVYTLTYQHWIYTVELWGRPSSFVPEPATALLALLAIPLMLVARRRHGIWPSA